MLACKSSWSIGCAPLALSVVIASYYEAIKRGNCIMWRWQKKQWPAFEWKESNIIQFLSEARLIQGQLVGRLSTFYSKVKTSIKADFYS